MSQLLIKNGTLVTLNEKREILKADILIQDNKIKKISKKIPPPKKTTIIDAKDHWVLPGFIQTHVHLCQTSFRNQAEDLELLDWLKIKTWPMEGNHSPKSLYESATLGITELLSGGTTTVLDMGTVHHTDQIFKAAQKLGIRAFIGKAMMDDGDDIPSSLKESTRDSLSETERLIHKWHGAENGRLKYALAPRFALSCSETLLQETVKLSKKYNILIHTHASENKLECEAVKSQKGLSTIRYLHKLGLCSSRSVFAHGVWLDEEEMGILATSHTHIAHCPSSNLKLGSGIANVPLLLRKGINVSLGADGAPCNNNLNMFQEMKLAGLIQKPMHGVKALSAQTILEMATLHGARALGMENELGSLEEGKLADIILVQQKTHHTLPMGDPYTTLVYSTQPQDIATVIIDGQVISIAK